MKFLQFNGTFKDFLWVFCNKYSDFYDNIPDSMTKVGTADQTQILAQEDFKELQRVLSECCLMINWRLNFWFLRLCQIVRLKH